jgi:hypothetical protein
MQEKEISVKILSFLLSSRTVSGKMELETRCSSTSRATTVFDPFPLRPYGHLPVLSLEYYFLLQSLSAEWLSVLFVCPQSVTSIFISLQFIFNAALVENC